MSVDLEAYYFKYAPMVIRRCRQLLKNEALAMDATQDTFVKLLQAQDKLYHESPSSLLYTTATYVCLNYLRSHKQKAETHDEEILLSIASHKKTDSLSI